MLLNDTSKTLFGKKLLLLIHHHADVDAVASAIALQTVFKEAQYVHLTELVPMAKKLLKHITLTS